MYDSLRDNMITAVGDEDMTVTSALSMLLRLQQIAGGFATDDTGNVTPIKDNKGIAELVSLVDEIDGCVIIWARFRAELAAIADALRVAYPDDTTVEYHGGISDTGKDEAVRLVQEGKARFFVANQQSGGTGLTLTKATTSIYYSQTFSLEDRLQSEDRNHRIGTDSTVTYITFVRRGTIDEKINEAFKHKKDFLDVFRKEVEGGSLWA
jgi:SNF2 family DNA or RNA helicase